MGGRYSVGHGFQILITCRGQASFTAWASLGSHEDPAEPKHSSICLLTGCNVTCCHRLLQGCCPTRMGFASNCETEQIPFKLDHINDVNKTLP